MMKIPILSLTLYLVAFVSVDGNLFSDIEADSHDVSNENNAQIIKMDQDYPADIIGFEEPCPNAEDIAPCVCTNDNNAMNLDCSDVESEEQLKQIFKSDFPIKNFTEFTLVDNKHLKVLESSVFGDVSFQNIDIRMNDIEVVEYGALDSCYKSAISLRFGYNKIKSFPFIDIQKLLKLFYIDLSGNCLSTIPADAFNGLSHLERIYIGGNHGTFSGYFQNIPNLVELDIQQNILSTIPTNFFKTGSNNLVVINLYNCQIVSVESDAFDISDNLKISVYTNLLTTLEEATWRPLLEAEVEIDPNNNPLDCGCEVAWLFGEDHLLDQVSGDTTCIHGDRIHDLDPEMFAEC